MSNYTYLPSATLDGHPTSTICMRNLSPICTLYAINNEWIKIATCVRATSLAENGRAGRGLLVNMDGATNIKM